MDCLRVDIPENALQSAAEPDVVVQQQQALLPVEVNALIVSDGGQLPSTASGAPPPGQRRISPRNVVFASTENTSTENAPARIVREEFHFESRGREYWGYDGLIWNTITEKPCVTCLMCFAFGLFIWWMSFMGWLTVKGIFDYHRVPK